MPVHNLTPGWYAGQGAPSSAQQQFSYTNPNLSSGLNVASSFIPNYSQTPILEGIANYAQSMAPQVYQWGMDQFNKNQGNIDTLMRNAMSYASPQRVAQEMGMAQSGVMQGAQAGRQNAIRDLQSYGIDPSAGRYAGLDMANQVMSGAAAAGAGNQQRMATQAAGNAMQNQAIQSGLANVQTGYGASNAMNQLLGTGMQLKYDPLGQASFGITGSSGGGGYSSSGATSGPYLGSRTEGMSGASSMGTLPRFAEGGDVPDEVSPSNGGKIDDVKANLTSGEFILPKDVVEFKGTEFFYKLMAQARRARAMAGDSGNGGGQQSSLGYGAA